MCVCVGLQSRGGDEQLEIMKSQVCSRYIACAAVQIKTGTRHEYQEERVMRLTKKKLPRPGETDRDLPYVSYRRSSTVDRPSPVTELLLEAVQGLYEYNNVDPSPYVACWLV